MTQLLIPLVMLIYQLLPRTFGNDHVNCVPYGTIEQNGCGKMNDITPKTLSEIKKLGVTHVWYTGLLEHATQTDYSAYGIFKEHPAMVKGKAGSPYAVKDYYDIDPDLASKPERRFKEFQNLVNRTHKAGLKVIMDFIPNHVARQYHSDNTPKGTAQLGENDDTSKAFSTDNNFYYLNAPLQCQFDMKGTAEKPYEEFPAKVTGNDCFSANPSVNDWYETVKLNYGVDYQDNRSTHFSPVPSTWTKMRDILLFWTAQKVDAFRCDMAEMVPCEFWGWVIPQIKEKNPDIKFIAEIYGPSQYRNYIDNGHFDYLYDKVGLYDTLRAVTCGQRPASAITDCWKSIEDIHGHMLNFLENHDEQRIASDFYIGDGQKGKAALIVSSCMNSQPFMLYAGQEFGERGMEEEGFSGKDGRTTIFDYWSIPTIRDWRNGGKYDSANLNTESKSLYDFYKKVLNISVSEKAISEGKFFDLMYANYQTPGFNAEKTFAFFRSSGKENILIAVNFSNQEVKQNINIPQHAIEFLGIKEGKYTAKELITDTPTPLHLQADKSANVSIPPYSGVMLKF